jgi:hypothetical protein
MSSLSRITNSLVSGNNENTLALANFNFDFSLVKFEAPGEFAPLGTALSTQRRKHAEDGLLHQVVRKLGALFEQLIPSTPKLIRAYGTRASEIIQAPGINPKGSRADGPFETFVGADATSVWAAATSGPASMAVLLLACILARSFGDAKVSTAVWVELVHERENVIKKSIENGELVSASSAMAARQNFSRDQLADFDASARAWLRSADEAKIKHQKQLELIVKNIPTSVSVGPSTYSKVVTAWREAMRGLEDLLNGMPQQISDGAILMALSAWHLYPDLIVLRNRTQKVNFSDALFPPTGVITVGLETTDASTDGGIQWSLTLSHLRYYGNPIRVDVQGDNSRVTMSQLCIVALGAFLATWDITPKNMFEAAKWIKRLWKHLLTGVEEEELNSNFPWLSFLENAASRLVNASEQDLKNYQMLLNFGSRRREPFMESSRHSLHRIWHTVPFFGLNNSFVLHALAAEDAIECAIRYLRNVAQRLALDESEAVIVYQEKIYKRPSQRSVDAPRRLFFATAIAHSYKTSKRSEDGTRKEGQRHARWLYEWIGRPTGSAPASKSCPLATDEDIQVCGARHWFKGCPLVRDQALIWPAAPRLYSKSRSCSSYEQNGYCYCLNENPLAAEAPRFLRFLGHESSIGLFVGRSDVVFLGGKHQEIIASSLQPEIARQSFSMATIPPLTLSRYMKTVSAQGPSRDFYDGVVDLAVSDEAFMLFLKIINPWQIHPQIISSLTALRLASQIYKQFPPATIPLKITLQRLDLAHWPMKDPEAGLRQETKTLRELSRAQVFSCLAMFESGGINIDPAQLKGVMAMSAGNSIFAAEVLLSDPAADLPAWAIKRIVGNIGRPGVSLLVVPSSQLRIRATSNDFTAVTHADYDYNRENNFEGTSLHLSFTGWKIPLVTGDQGFIDEDVHFLEAVISVRERGIWVADIDVLGSLQNITRDNANKADCTHPPLTRASGELISIDSWDELLDPPHGVSIVRSRDNWVGRLAATCVARRQFSSTGVFVLRTEWSCLKCLEVVHLYQKGYILID